jgi:two-component system sensor histidine kinase YesM
MFVVFLSRTLTNRLKLLVKNMSKISDGKFDVFVRYEGNDEISELYASFKNMVERINTLINEVYVLDIEKKDAEIKALQSQINPHFLFNTMESIRMNLWNKQDYETSEIIQKFSKLLRKSIDWGTEKIALKQEIDLVETYLKIQQYRYKNKFEYTIEIDETLFDCVIPKFTLQPIVENAIYHGIEMKKGKSMLFITTEIVNNDFKIIIQDDGVGIDEEKLCQIKEQILQEGFSSSNSRIGIRNVHQRIQLSYGRNYGIIIDSKKNSGTKVEILLPKIIN